MSRKMKFSTNNNFTIVLLLADLLSELSRKPVENGIGLNIIVLGRRQVTAPWATVSNSPSLYLPKISWKKCKIGGSAYKSMC